MNNHFTKPDWPAPASVIAFTTTRSGGCSHAPYDSLNLAAHVADDIAAVQSNRATALRELPPAARVQWLDQVHGVDVIEAGQGTNPPQADASWSRAAGQGCAVLTADCLPVLFCSRSGDVVAAAHAGWRGLLGGVLENTVAAMGVEPRLLLAWLGPAIGPAAFEVGPEVRSAFLDAARPNQQRPTNACFVPNLISPGYFFADLYALARLRLAALDPDAIFGGSFCTYTERNHYFSFRRDGQTGRMASLILIDPR